MKRLIYCVAGLLLASAPGMCFGQAIGEMMQVQPRISPAAPTMPGDSSGSPRVSKIRRRIPSTGGGILNIGKTPYKLPAKTTSAGQPAPAFTVHGDDADDEAQGIEPTATPKAPPGPAKAASPASSAKGMVSSAPPS